MEKAAVAKSAGLVQVPLIGLRAGEEISFPVFLERENGSEPVLFADAGRVLDEDKLDRLADSGIEFFLVPRDKLSLFYRHLEEGLATSLQDQKVGLGEKCRLLHTVALNAAESLLKKKPTKSTVRRVTGIVETAVASLEVNPRLSREVRKMLTGKGELHHHCVNTALYSLSVGMIVYRRNLEEVRNLALAALLHDLGRTPQGPDGEEGVPGTIYGDKQYEPDYTHTTRGAQLLMELGCCEEAVLAAAEHHERADGSGAPQGLSGKRISLTARIVSLLNVFDHIRASQQNYLGVYDTFKVVLDSYRNCFDAEVTQAFLQTFAAGKGLRRRP